MNKRLLRSDKFALGTGRTCVRPECSVAGERVHKGPDSTAKEYFFGAHGEPRHHSKVLDAATYGTEGENLNELLLTTAIAAMISMGAMALFKRC
jgi:hypothetical protein